MAPGADKRIAYDPPGAIGLVDREAVLLIRFDETDDSARPQDAARAMTDFDVTATGVLGSRVMPPIVPAALGRGRLFTPGAGNGLLARDLDTGSTLLTRDMSIQLVMSWDAAAQLASGQPGVIVVRGLGTGSAEFVSYGLELDVVDAPTFTGKLRWFWEDVGGGEHLAAGVNVVIPPGQFTLITATRRWVSPTQVELAYYVGDQLAGVETSASGSIGGGTTGTMQLGFRSQGSPGNEWAGVLDELMIVGRELCAEEVEATWLRIVTYQPLGNRLFLEMFDGGFPISDEPDSDVQLDIRMTGQSIGFAAAQTENLRANFLPQRAYGSTLQQWEEAVAVTPKPAQGIEARRARVLARLRQRRGVSIPGIKDALLELVDCDVDDLVFIAYSNTITDGFDTVVEPLLWDMTPTGCAAANAGRARFAPGAGDYTLSSTSRLWRTIARTVSQPVAPVDELLGVILGGEQVIAKLVFTTPQDTCEAGVWVGDKSAGNYLVLGLRDVAGSFKVVTESFIAGISQGLVVQATLGANPAAIWLYLRGNAFGGWTPAWSVTGPSSDFTNGGAITHPHTVHWAGCYLRGVASGAPVADFDDFVLYMPNGTRPFNAYVYRNPALGGSPDLEGAHSVLQAIKHAFTHATIITSLAVLNADPGSPCDRGPMGAL
ncbi:MAG TPA: putative phage tail protein [Methylomirabilota bacterium]|nr:putative phage tail protein [Methylomirabilota bacterium]